MTCAVPWLCANLETLSRAVMWIREVPSFWVDRMPIARNQEFSIFFSWQLFGIYIHMNTVPRLLMHHKMPVKIMLFMTHRTCHFPDPELYDFLPCSTGRPCAFFACRLQQTMSANVCFGCFARQRCCAGPNLCATRQSETRGWIGQS